MKLQWRDAFSRFCKQFKFEQYVDALTDNSAATKFIGRSDTSTTSPAMEAISLKEVPS